jgi:hypothetical protein
MLAEKMVELLDSESVDLKVDWTVDMTVDKLVVWMVED